MYVYIYICTYIYIYFHIFAYICISYICMYLHIFTYTGHIFAYVCNKDNESSKTRAPEVHLTCWLVLWWWFFKTKRYNIFPMLNYTPKPVFFFNFVRHCVHKQTKTNRFFSKMFATACINKKAKPSCFKKKRHRVHEQKKTNRPTTTKNWNSSSRTPLDTLTNALCGIFHN